MIEFTHHLQCANWPRDATDQSRWPRRYFEYLFCVISRDASIDHKNETNGEGDDAQTRTCILRKFPPPRPLAEASWR